MRTWVNDPHSGGVKIPDNVKQRTKQRILAYAEQHYSGKYIRIDVRFKGYLLAWQKLLERSRDPVILSL
ncbi:hypothetical protein DSM107007_55570 [Nostoc sp. PCC 7120 = FACHB-418]|uniref:hypothetical protein n=1 Tax=Nostoc sp. (strain PCC 7120 / SAG 25.82 / UTEX 2576) TaxID=103690 RepID=UPI000F8D7DB5|nr:hypothetical protein [Nostoc sp. PCC 7120 = FACHB-418]RUR73013.1 hypothetical protein DSM107007_55570 [Nostoc sp. PCC 7120 = FACHB-418]